MQTVQSSFRCNLKQMKGNKLVKIRCTICVLVLFVTKRIGSSEFLLMLNPCLTVENYEFSYFSNKNRLINQKIWKIKGNIFIFRNWFAFFIHTFFAQYKNWNTDSNKNSEENVHRTYVPEWKQKEAEIFLRNFVQKQNFLVKNCWFIW